MEVIFLTLGRARHLFGEKTSRRIADAAEFISLPLSFG